MLSKLNVSLAVSAATLSSAKAGKCPFGFDSDVSTPTDLAKTNETKKHPRVKSDYDYPSDIFGCSARDTGYGIPTTDDDVDVDTYEAIVADVIAKYEAVDDTVSDNTNPRAKFAGCLVRTAGHDFMDYRNEDGAESGGADGCMAFADGDNTGLADCLVDSGLADTYEDYCETVSLADFLVIIGEAVMGRTHQRYDADDYYAVATPARIFRENFKFGRTSAITCSTALGLMPNPEDGCDGLSDIFIDHIYAESEEPWRMTAAISGAHTLGSATIANSGYDGFWGDSTQAGLFNNDYYKGILFKGWGIELAVDGNSAKNQWKRIDGGADNTHKEMMLNTDMCLAMEGNSALASAGRNRGARRDAEDSGESLLADQHNCCAWMEINNLPLQNGDEFCGGTLGPRGGRGGPGMGGQGMGGGGGNRGICCAEEDEDSFGDCDDVMTANGPAFDDVLEFAGDNLAFIRAYVTAWGIATTNGFSDLWAIGSGQGLVQFNAQVEEEEMDNSCTADINICWNGLVSNLWPCLMDYLAAQVYCFTNGGAGAPIEEEF